MAHRRSRERWRFLWCRKLAVEEEEIARKAIEDQGCTIVELSEQEHEAFVEVVRPLYRETYQRLGGEMFEMLGIKL